MGDGGSQAGQQWKRWCVVADVDEEGRLHALLRECAKGAVSAGCRKVYQGAVGPSCQQASAGEGHLKQGCECRVHCREQSAGCCAEGGDKLNGWEGAGDTVVAVQEEG